MRNREIKQLAAIETRSVLDIISFRGGSPRLASRNNALPQYMQFWVILQRRERSRGLPDVPSRNHWLQQSKELLLERSVQPYVFSMKPGFSERDRRMMSCFGAADLTVTLGVWQCTYNIFYMNNLRMCQQVNSFWGCTPWWLLRDVDGDKIIGRK